MEMNVLCWQCIFIILLLLVISNGMPVLARQILGGFGAWPIDFGITFYDKNPLFGYSKTWRGLVTAILSTTLIAPVFGLSFQTGALFGMLVMSGDLAASFAKRRLGLVESSRFRIIDVLPESLLPVFILRDTLELNILTGFISVALFFIFEVILSPILFKLHIRKKPY
jgi:CDP-2,3-bis-(O-geranylgeranyl)-sn-glycerol synthase